MILTPYRHNIYSGSSSSAFIIANSFLLDGVDEYFNADSLVANVSSDTVGTINVLTKSVNILPSAVARITSFGYTTGQEGIDIAQLTTGEVRLLCQLGGTIQYNVTTDSAIDLTSWTLISIIQDGVQPKILINGVEIAQTTTNPNGLSVWLSSLTNIDNFRIGQFSRNSTINYDYNGYISHISYLNTNISTAQCLDFYNEGQPKNPQILFGANCKFFFNPDNSGDTAQFSVVDSVNSITATSVNLEDADKTTETPY